jgi:nitrite reductase (NADH) large subunit
MGAQKKLLVVGNGMASLKFLEELTAVAPGRFQVTVIGAEAEPAYNRVLLSSLLSGEIAAADVAMKSRDWYVDNDITLLTGRKVAGLLGCDQVAELEDRSRVPFDVCVLATGSHPIVLPLPGNDLQGVITFRTLSDVAWLTDHAQSKAPAVVIGGGLLGIEAAVGLARAGVPTTLVHVMDKLMERQLDAQGAALLRMALEERHINVELEASTKQIVGTTHVEGVELADGRVIPCGLVVMAVGVRANAELAKAAGLKVGRGIVVSNQMQTSDPNIFAIGECAEHEGTCYGLVEPAYDQAKILARALAGSPSTYTGSVLATNLKVSGVPVFSAGTFNDDDAEIIVLRDRQQGSYRKFLIRNETLIGVVLVGDTTDALWYRSLISARTPIADLRSALAFGRGFAEAA